MGLKRKLNIKMLTSIRVIIFALLGHVISIPFSSIGGFTTPGPGSGGLASSSDYDYYNYDYDYSSGHVFPGYPSWTTSYTPFESSTIYYYSSYTPTSSWQGDNSWYGSGSDAIGSGSSADAIGSGSLADAIGSGSLADAIGSGSSADAIGSGSSADASES